MLPMEKSNQNYIVLTQGASSRNSGGWAASRVWEQGHGLLDVGLVGGVYRSRRSPEDFLPSCSCSASPQQLGWGRTRWRDWDTNISECLCTLRGFLWSSLNSMDVWLAVCATTWIKKTFFILIPRIASKTNTTWYSHGTSAHKCTFIYIHPWSLTLSLKGVLVFHPCFIEEATKIRKTCSQFIQLRALNQLVSFCILEVTLATVSWKDAIPIN